AAQPARLSAARRIASAGVHAWPGKSADATGVAVARELGIDLARHRAKMLDDAMVDSAELLLVMDRLNEAELVSRYPRAGRRVVLLGEFDRARSRDPAIADPYMRGPDAVRESFQRIAAAVDGLVRTLSEN